MIKSSLNASVRNLNSRSSEKQVKGSTAMEGLSSDCERLDSLRGTFYRRRRRCVRINLATPRPHRLRNVLQGLRSHIIENEIDLAPNLPMRVVGDANASWFRDTLEVEPRC